MNGVDRSRRRALGALIGALLTEICPRVPTAMAAADEEDLAVKHGLTLAVASQVVLSEPEPAIVVLLEGEQLFADGGPAGTTAALRERQHPARLDDFWHVMVDQRAAWKRAHPGEDWPGIAFLWLDAKTPGLVVKSLLATAALAGSPNVSLAVRSKSNPKGIARTNVGVLIPPAPGKSAPAANELVLHVEAAFDTPPTVTWKRGAETVETVPVSERTERGKPAYPGLAAAVSKSWTARGKHRTPDDRHFDPALIHPANELPLQTLVALVDAVYAPERSFRFKGKVEQVPAFNILVDAASR